MTNLANAYGRAAGAWSEGPERLYRRLSAALVAACPPLTGRRVLDLGAGTGALSRVVADQGGEVVAIDLAVGMLAHDRARRPPGVVADVRRLPFSGGAFDAALAAFVLNHLDEPVQALREAARVTREGGCVAAATFAAGWDHPAKAAVDRAARAVGFRPPAWYVELKSHAMAASDRPEALLTLAGDAGLCEPTVRSIPVDGGLDEPLDMVRWRLGMAHLAPFVAGLTARRRDQLVAAALAELGERPPPVRPTVLALTARVDATS